MSTSHNDTLSVNDTLSAIEDIALLWGKAGRTAPLAVPQASGALCSAPQCVALAWVRLKVARAGTTLCFRHFQAVSELVKPASTARARA